MFSDTKASPPLEKVAIEVSTTRSPQPQSELVRIDLEHIARDREGIVVTLPRSRPTRRGGLQQPT
jgi:hypothetical protein